MSQINNIAVAAAVLASSAGADVIKDNFEELESRLIVKEVEIEKNDSSTATRTYELGHHRVDSNWVKRFPKIFKHSTTNDQAADYFENKIKEINDDRKELALMVKELTGDSASRGYDESTKDKK